MISSFASPALSGPLGCNDSNQVMRRSSLWLARAVLLALAVLVCAAPPGWGDERVIHVVCIIRHGDRTPYSAPGTNIHPTWPARPGELTPTGMQQEYHLGQSYRQSYVEGEHLLPASYDGATLEVVSTQMNRTIMSAQCVLAGLYPPGTGPRFADGAPVLPHALQVIPVFTIPNDARNFINPGGYPDGETRRLLKSALQEPRFARVLTEHAADLKRWEDVIGCKLSTLPELMETADYLNCMLVHNVPLPAGLDKAEARRIVSLGFGLLADLYARPDVTRAMTGELLSRVVTALREAARQDRDGTPTPRKMEIYSGHDVTVLAVLSALNQPQPSNVPYAAHIELELLKGEHGYNARVRYNGQALTLGGSSTPSLDQLEDLLRGVTEKH